MKIFVVMLEKAGGDGPVASPVIAFDTEYEATEYAAGLNMKHHTEFAYVTSIKLILDEHEINTGDRTGG